MKEIHHMHLHKVPFDGILSGSQTIETRINDEKRRLLKVGDRIEFVSRENPENKFVAEIVDLLKYKTFDELYSSLPSQEFGGGDLNELLTSIYKYYTKEEETEWGVIGVKLKVLRESND